MQTKEHLLTQTDYLKILIEEDRFGEVYSKLEELKGNLQQICKRNVERFSQSELELPKSITKTKPENWIFLNKTWVKIVAITKNEITMEVSKGNVIKKFYRIKKDNPAISHATTATT